MLGDIGVNLLSDFIFSILVFLVFLCVFLITKRRKLLKFFGLEKSKKITIFTSNLLVEKFGSRGVGRVRYSFQGAAIPSEESKAAAFFQALFNYFLPSQVEKPGFLSKILISDINVKIIPSPIENNLVEQSGTIVSFGFPPYNSISQLIEETFNPLAKLEYIHTEQDSNSNPIIIDSQDKNNEISFNNSGSTGIPYGDLDNYRTISPSGIPGDNYSYLPGITSGSAGIHVEDNNEQPLQPVIKIRNIEPKTDNSLGFIQKIYDSQNKRYFFYIAGLSENSTTGSAYFLMNNWELLEKNFGNEAQFCVLVKVSNTDNRTSQIILKLRN